MDKLIVLSNDGKQAGENFKCITPQLSLAPHSQVCLVATKIRYENIVEVGHNDIMLVNIPNLPIASPNCTPQKFGLLQTIGILNTPVIALTGEDPVQYIDGNFMYHNTSEKWVNLNNQETLNLNELHVLITNHLGVPITPADTDTAVVIKFRQDPNFVAQSNMQLQRNMMRDLMLEQQTKVVQAQNI